MDDVSSDSLDRRKDEYLERLWVLRERGNTDLGSLAEGMGDDFDPDLLAEMAAEGLVEMHLRDNAIALSGKGNERARRIIRAHRIGELLLSDVFGGNIEDGACEFEHTVTVELVDGLCTLLGHPRKCPHGNPIPEGDCCRNFDKKAYNAVCPLTDMHLGQRARVAYIDCRDNSELRKLNGFQVRPGVELLLQQKYPCLVVECEGSVVALDADIAAGIRVWSKSKPRVETHHVPHVPHGGQEAPRRAGWRFWKRRV